MHAHCSFTTCHPSRPSLPDHPIQRPAARLLVLRRLVSILVLRLLARLLVLLRLATIMSICMYLSRVRRGRGCRVLHSGFPLGDYDTISRIRTRNE